MHPGTTPRCRCHAGFSRENLCEIALVGKSTMCRYCLYRQQMLRQHIFSAIDAHARQPLMRCEARGFLEFLRKVVRRQSGCGGDRRDGKLVGQIIEHEFLCCFLLTDRQRALRNTVTKCLIAIVMQEMCAHGRCHMLKESGRGQTVCLEERHQCNAEISEDDIGLASSAPQSVQLGGARHFGDFVKKRLRQNERQCVQAALQLDGRALL